MTSRQAPRLTQADVAQVGILLIWGCVFTAGGLYGLWKDGLLTPMAVLYLVALSSGLVAHYLAFGALVIFLRDRRRVRRREGE